MIKRAGIFNPGRVEELLALTPEQTLPQHERALWLLITFELWRRKVGWNEKLVKRLCCVCGSFRGNADKGGVGFFVRFFLLFCS